MNLQKAKTCQLKVDPSELNACNHCQRRRLCKNLSQALETIDLGKHCITDLRLYHTRKLLRKRLDELGFLFPSSPQLCMFSELDPNQARYLLFQARDLHLEWSEFHQATQGRDKS
ncbi:MAG: hypothetical protein NTX25_03265 [Proteobacteria bacterium]|nr:hypothetical protein [Pseudomonadota bacterium]